MKKPRQMTSSPNPAVVHEITIQRSNHKGVSLCSYELKSGGDVLKMNCKVPTVCTISTVNSAILIVFDQLSGLSRPKSDHPTCLIQEINQIASKASGIPQNIRSGIVNFRNWLINRTIKIDPSIETLLFSRDSPTLSRKVLWFWGKSAFLSVKKSLFS